MHRPRGFTLSALRLALPGGITLAHPGRRDGNGCRHETASGGYHPNRETGEAAGKSPGNVCHDETSPNYSTIRHFVASAAMGECQSSGGRARK